MFSQFHKVWGVILGVAILNAVIGLLIFFPVRPDLIPVLVGILLLAGAVIAGVYVAALGKGRDPWLGILTVVLRVVTGFLVLFYESLNLDDYVTFTTLMGIYFGVEGAFLLVEAKKFKRQKDVYSLMMINGVTGVVFCILIFRFMSGAPYARVAALVAITFWIRAIVGIRFALLAKNAGPLVPSAEVAAPQPEPAPAPPAQ
jgi:uncharacterized membrane protein HdeD (DUF308 family)